jgi:hypothetical protein
MRIPTAALFASLLFAQGCVSTHDAGWQGQNATPFGTAEVLCNAEADQNPGAKEMAFRTCMGRHGWTRGRRS